MKYNLEIPDPFTAFVSKRKRYVTYNRFAREWHMKCGCCQEDIYAPTRKTLKSTRLFHTRNICLGGY
jgi:hypothetical protein